VTKFVVLYILLNMLLVSKFLTLNVHKWISSNLFSEFKKKEKKETNSSPHDDETNNNLN